MTIRIDNVEGEALLVNLVALTGRHRDALLLEALRREQARLTADKAQSIADGHGADAELRRRWNAGAGAGPRPVEDALAYDENGLPA